MSFRVALAGILLALLGCKPPLGRVRVSIIFDNETRTQCIKASARNAAGTSVSSEPSAIRREGRDSLVLGLGQTVDLVGDVAVSVFRFTTDDCAGSPFAAETQQATLKSGAGLGNLVFRFSDFTGDGGVDGGPASDSGVDGGCAPAACTSPGECQRLPAAGCKDGGTCLYTSVDAGISCGNGGLCNGQGQCAPVCEVLANGSTCDDGLPCTRDTCNAGACIGTCARPPECNRVAPMISCNPDGGCQMEPDSSQDTAACGSGSGFSCLDGGCRSWLAFTPSNFSSTITSLPYPTQSWRLSSLDGGSCITVISTSGPMASVDESSCDGTPSGITSAVNDAGVSVITMTGLDVGPQVTLQFVGDRPVQLLVLGDSSVTGLVSVAPLVAKRPAGAPNPGCATVGAGGAGVAQKQGGGGGGFGGKGGNGGQSGGMGGEESWKLHIPLVAGCSGGEAYGGSDGGVGGGALQLIVAGSLSVSDGGIISASGGGGSAGTADFEGGGGGGSGGTVIVEAWLLNLNGGAITANGGGGGEGGATGQTSVPGPIGSLGSASTLDPVGASSGGEGGRGGDANHLNGRNGDQGSGTSGGGGGGGSVGVVYVYGRMSCAGRLAVISGKQPKSISCPN